MMVIRAELEKEISGLEIIFKETNKGNSKISECARDKNDVVKMIDKLTHEA